MSIKNGMARFDFYMLRLHDLLFKASLEPDPALWLYTNDARTTVFMLEALAKVYSNLHNQAMFIKIKEHFKLLEDMLGGIDYYDNFYKRFLKKEAVPPSIISFLENKRQEKIDLLNEALVEKKWTKQKGNRLIKIREKITNADWMKPEKEMNALKTFYQHSIIEINVFYGSADRKFSKLENQVHELRRKLRWLSIYPQALRGCIQLTDSKPQDEALNKYITPEIINSPFNKLPDAEANTYLLLLEKKYYLALSSMISELGKLKDAGLEIIMIESAMKEHNFVPQNMTAYSPDSNGETTESILSRATNMCNMYFDEKNLEKLIVTVSVGEVSD